MRRRVLIGGCLAAALACGGKSEPPPVASTSTDTAVTQTRTRLPVEHWARMLGSRVRQEQKGALGMLGEYELESVPYIPAVVRYIESDDDSLAFTAAWALAQMGPAAVPPLVRGLSNSSPRVRRRAAYGLGEMGAEAISSVSDLDKLATTDPVIEVRYMAQWAIDKIANRGLIADRDLFLTAGLTDSDQKTRLEAIRRLGASHPSDRVAVTELIRLLGDTSEVIRRAAIDALTAKGAPAIPALTMALNSPRQIIRSGAMMAMSRLHRTF